MAWVDLKWNKTENKIRRKRNSSSSVLRDIPLAKHSAKQWGCVNTHICIIKMRFPVPFLNLPVTIVVQIMVLQWASGCTAFAVGCLGTPLMPTASKKYSWYYHALYQHVFPTKAIPIKKRQMSNPLLFLFPIISSAIKDSPKSASFQGICILYIHHLQGTFANFTCF